MKLKFNKKSFEKEIQKTFPNTTITSYKKFKKGLVHKTFKVKKKSNK